VFAVFETYVCTYWINLVLPLFSFAQYWYTTDHG
jgi:hypothetical protein